MEAQAEQKEITIEQIYLFDMPKQIHTNRCKKIGKLFGSL